MKKVSFVFLLAILIVSVLTPIKQANAQGNDGRIFVPLKISSKKFVPLADEELEEIRKNDEYTVELTYDQAVERTSEITGDSIKDIKKENPNSTKDVKKVGIGARTLGQATATATATATCTWTETSTTHTVKSHNAKLIVIVRACRDGSFGWIEKSKKPMLQEFKASSKSFKGTVKVDLESSGYFYVANGNFYNNTSVSHSGTTGSNTVFTATYTVTSTSDHYGALYTGVKWKQVTN
ncbi:hypothetical protein H7T43_25490 [Peribacillus simplex]|uniref:hypothetical protein n=1 Tax=Peribacillus simplex TaxID=1478 RepID=UPI002989F1D2|nr:hypothetical protein [Peribacillus simplex]MBX9958201.1 hypothetical protein [Peribacillus simplex]